MGGQFCAQFSDASIKFGHLLHIEMNRLVLALLTTILSLITVLGKWIFLSVQFLAILAFDLDELPTQIFILELAMEKFLGQLMNNKTHTANLVHWGLTFAHLVML